MSCPPRVGAARSRAPRPVAGGRLYAPSPVTAANRLHTVVTMVELGRPEEAVQFAVDELRTSQELADRLLDAVQEPALAALLLGKVAQAHERGVELVISPRTRLRETGVAPRDLVSVVGNLLDNAVDAALAAPPPRTVQVSVTEDGTGLVVRVEDSGPGLGDVPPEQVFHRDWSTKHGPAGAPPGARARARRAGRPVLRRHGAGGRRGRTGRGRRVHRRPAPAGHRGGPAISPDRTGPATIAVLVVDDDPTIAAGHAQYVARVPGFEVAGVAHSGAAALAMLDRTPADLVLLDFFLPDMSGLDVCRAIRSRERLVDVIAVTSARDLAVVRAPSWHSVSCSTCSSRSRRRPSASDWSGTPSTDDRSPPGGATDQGEVDRALAPCGATPTRRCPRG